MRLFDILLIALVPVSAVADDKPSSQYLKDGKLTAVVEVIETQSGFAGPTGEYYTIEPNGAWSKGDYLFAKNGKGPAKAKGKLTSAQMTQLAKDLARYDLATLPSHGKAESNPQVIQVRYGRRVRSLQPGPDGPEAKDTQIRKRYIGIADTLKSLCKEPAKDK